MIGAQIDDYRILEKVGDGGMGSVYRAVDVMLEREVALKFLRPELAQQPDLVERFRAEAVVLARLNHPGIASLYGLRRHNDQFFMVMEYVPGETLEAVLRREGRLSPQRAVPLAGEVLDALDYAHKRGVIHRDIKTANVIVTPAGGVKVMDFGIARVLGTERRTRVGFVVGTIGYMAPEQIQGLEVDGRTDIYALGVVLYEMLTGRMPFEGPTEYAVMQAQIEQRPVLPRTYAAVPLPLENTVMRALSKQAQDRFQSATEFHVALQTAARQASEWTGPEPPAWSDIDETREFKSDPRLLRPNLGNSGQGPFAQPPSGEVAGRDSDHTRLSGPAMPLMGQRAGTPVPPPPPGFGPAPAFADDDDTTRPQPRHWGDREVAGKGPTTPGVGYPVPPTPSSAWGTRPSSSTPAAGLGPPQAADDDDTTRPEPLQATASTATPAQPGTVVPPPLPAASRADGRRAAEPPRAPSAAASRAPVPPAATAPPAASVDRRPPSAPPARPAPPKPAKARGPGLVVIAAVVGIVALAAAGFVAWQALRPAPEAEPPVAVASESPLPESPSSAVPAEPGASPLPAPPSPASPAAPLAPTPTGSTVRPSGTARPPAPSSTPKSALPSPSPAVDVAPPLVPAPDPVPAPATPQVPPAMFGNVKWFQVEGSRAREMDVFLQLTADSVKLLDRRARDTLLSVPYSSISHVTYTQGKRPGWRKDVGPSVFEGAFSDTVRTFHYMAFQGPQQFLLVRVDRDDLRRLRDELRKRPAFRAELSRLDLP